MGAVEVPLLRTLGETLFDDRGLGVGEVSEDTGEEDG